MRCCQGTYIRCFLRSRSPQVSQQSATRAISFTSKPAPQPSAGNSQDFDPEPPQYDFEAAEKTYNVSDLLLELDAADGPYTKAAPELKDFNTSLYGAVKAKGNVGGNAHKIRSSRYHERLDRHSKWAVSESATPSRVDFLAMVLIGTTISDIPLSSIQRQLRLFAQRNRLNIDEIEDASAFRSVLRSMKELSEGSTDLTDPTYLGTDQGARRAIATIRACRTLWELTRITDMLTQTHVGCSLLSTNGAAILKTIQSIVTHFSGQHIDALRYFNNLITSIESNGVDMGPALCHGAMLQATQARVSSALKHYITLADQRNYPPSSIGLRALTSLQLASKRVHSYKQDVQDWNMPDRLQLLTGFLSGLPSEGKSRAPSFALFATKSYIIYWAYLNTLATQGAEEVLMYEYQHPELTPIPTFGTNDEPLLQTRLRRPKSKEHITIPEAIKLGQLSRDELFIGAFIQAGNSRYARQALMDSWDKWAKNVRRRVRPMVPSVDKSSLKEMAGLWLRSLVERKDGEFSFSRMADELEALCTQVGSADAVLRGVEDLLRVRWVEGSGDEGQTPGYHEDIVTAASTVHTETAAT